MLEFAKSLLELTTFVTSVFLIIAGSSSKEKYSSAEYIRKRILILGIILLVFAVICGLPDMYHGFIQGWNHTRNIH